MPSHHRSGYVGHHALRPPFLLVVYALLWALVACNVLLASATPLMGNTRPQHHLLTSITAAAHTTALPPATPAEPWHTLNDSLLPYPVFHAATAVLDNSVLLLGGCLTATCDIPVGHHNTSGAHLAGVGQGAWSADSPYHERSIALEVETRTMSPLPRLTLPGGLGFAGRHAAVTLTDSVYVPRSCTMTTLAPHEIAAMSEGDMRRLQEAYAPVIAFYPDEKKKKKRRTVNGVNAVTSTALHDDRATSVNTSYFEVPADRVRVNASCTALATENKILILGGFLLSSQRVTSSVDAFDVVTRKYETDVAFLSAPVLQPSVASSSGFAAVVGGWTFTPTTDAQGVEGSAPDPAPTPLRPTIEYFFDLLFFEGERANQRRLRPRKKTADRAVAFSASARSFRSGATICVSPVHAEMLPRAVVEDILLSPRGCHVEVFGGQVVLTDHNLGSIAVLDLRATSAADADKVRERTEGGGAQKCQITAVASASSSSTSSSSTSSASSSSSQPTPPPPPTEPPTPSPTPAPTPPPEPVYHYRWEQPMLIPLPLSRQAVTTTTDAGAGLMTISADDAPDTSTDTILVFMALGGEDVWRREVTRQRDVDGASSSTDPSPSPPEDVVVRRAAAQRWAQRLVPDTTYDADRDDLLAVRMPTPHWPTELVLQTTAEGTVHLNFPDVNYTHFCAWAKEEGGEETVVCAVRLSSRRDCVGNTAGTLDALYNGAPNISVPFSATGSATPVYVCFGYVVQPPSRPSCRSQRSFSVLNPMMPLRIADNTPTPPPPTPPPTQDPSDKTTSSPLFVFAVGISMVTLIVAVLLVARLQHVPEEGLLGDSLFNGGNANSSGGGGGRGGRQSHVQTSSQKQHYRRGGGGGYARVAGSRGQEDALLGAPLNGEQQQRSPSDGQHGSGDHPPCRLTSLVAFTDLCDSVAEANEARMLDAAGDVLRLHQHRYRILSRVGQGAHSLCFLALRKPPAAVAPSSQGRRGMPQLPVMTQHITDAVSGFRRNNGDGICGGSSSLWAARYNHQAAVVVKYTQCPDDTTRAVITRLCERLRDLRAGGGVYSLASISAAAAVANANPQLHGRHSRTNSASGWLRDQQQQMQTHYGGRRTSISSDAALRAVSGISASTVLQGHVSGAARPVSGHGEEAIGEDNDVEAGVCAWLDAHEVDVVLSLFLLLPADLFVSYEVSVLQQQQQQQMQQQQRQRQREIANAVDRLGGVRQGASVYRVTAEWNQQCIYAEQPPEHHRSDEGEEKHGIRARLARRWRTTGPRGDVVDSSKTKRCPAAVRAFVASLATPASAPRVCWDACLNPLQPSTESAWSLCLVMPYERAGDLGDFVQRAQQALPVEAWRSPLYWGGGMGVRVRDELLQDTGSSTPETGVVRQLLPLARVRHCWSESLLCSLLFQVSAGLQLLHQQSPPILQGNLKATNVLLREPTTFTLSGRRVYSTPAAGGGGNGGGSRGSDTHSEASGGVDPLLTLHDGGGRYCPAWVGPPPHHNSTAASLGSTAAAAHPPASSSSPVLLPPPPEWYLSNKSYIPVSVTDGGMSWWLRVQLPHRLRGCFGHTTHATLRQTPAGRCWLRRYVDASVPSDDAVTGLAHVLVSFLEVPSHIAPELIWGQLCRLSSAAAVTAGDTLSFNGLQHQQLQQKQRCRQRQRQRQRASGLAAHRRCSGENSGRRDLSVDSPRTHAEAPNDMSGALAEAHESTLPHDAGYTTETSRNPNEDMMLNAASMEDITEGIERGEDAGETEPATWMDTNVKKDDEDEEKEDEKGEEDVEEEGVFSLEEVAMLTSTMWKAGGLTRVTRRPPARERGAGSAEESTAVNTPAASSQQQRGVPSMFSGVPPAAAVSPLLPHQLSYAAGGNHYYHITMGTGGNGSGGGGDFGGGEGSQGSSGVYEMLVQRVLAMDTASDVWSLGVLLYGMCTEAIHVAPSSDEDTAEKLAPRRRDAAEQQQLTPAATLSLRAFAALLGDLYALSAGSAPPSFLSPDEGSSDMADASTRAARERDDPDRLWWPRSCALEDDVETSFRAAGYSATLSQLLARTLSPVATRRPSAAEVVDQVRLVAPPVVNTGGGASPPNTQPSPVNAALGGVHHVPSRQDVVCDVTRRAPRNGLCRGSAAGEGGDGDSVGYSSVVLNERTVVMVLRRRSWH